MHSGLTTTTTVEERMTNWDAELKKIDKQLESMSDSALIPAPAKP